MLTLLALFSTAALTAIAAIAVNNLARFPRLAAGQGLDQRRDAELQRRKAESVSLLIPARDEAATIGATVAMVLAQTPPPGELFVLDDHSDDATARIATSSAEGNGRFKLICGQPLLPGWMGKNWACHQLAQAAHGAVLVFTDADVRWQPDALAALLAQMETMDADLLTVWPTQTTVTWGERLTVPLMALTILSYLPVQLAHATSYPIAAAANGQCMAFRRGAYAAIGGHAAVRGAIVEDIRLAQRIKAAGLHLRMADGNGLIGCRMYASSSAAIDGYTKNILAGHGGRVSLLLLSTVFHWLLFLFPWFWLLFGAVWPAPGYPFWPLALVATGVGVRGLTAYATHQRVADALLMPLSVLLMTWIAARALLWQWRYGGVKWKGRIVPNRGKEPTA
jgi:chlorobactene glucosyltransferase